MSGAKSDAADAHLLADLVRTSSHHLRPVAADNALAQAVRVVTRMRKTLIRERTHAVQRWRQAHLKQFPAALADRLVGLLHGGLNTGLPYNETTAWAHQTTQPPA